MSKKQGMNRADRFKYGEKWLREIATQVTALGMNDSDFLEYRFKRREDGTVLAIAKRIGDDGAPQVCFAQGWDWPTALFMLEESMAANAWRAEKPWKPRTAES